MSKKTTWWLIGGVIAYVWWKGRAARAMVSAPPPAVSPEIQAAADARETYFAATGGGPRGMIAMPID